MVADAAAKLVYFSVFDPSLAPSEECAGDQICYFHPNTTPANYQIRQVGLAQALINFTTSFSPHRPCEIVHTKLHRIAMIQPEPSYWIIIKVGLPTPARDAMELPDLVLQKLLWKAYNAFKLLNKSFAHVNTSQSPGALRQRLDEFYSAYLAKLPLYLSHPDLISSLDTLHFLPLYRAPYLQTLSLVQDLEARFANIAATLVLWKHHLVSSGLNDLVHLKSFYDYITDPETGKIADGVVSMVKPKGEPVISSRPTTLRSNASALAAQSPSALLFSALSPRSSKFTGFIVPALGETIAGTTTSMSIHPKKLYIGPDAEEMFLVVYQYRDDLTIVLFISSEHQTAVQDRGFYTALRTFFDSKLPTLASVISDGCSRTTKSSEYTDQHYRYLYYNAANLAFKTSIGSYKTAAITPEIVQCMNELHEDFESPVLNLTETCVRSVSEFWIIGRKSQGREFYLVLSKPEMTLLDVDEEMQKLTHTHFPNIFLD
ncbi:hypothetical protein SeMB42_g06280 [Synchytrium endobioticum]|uniref:CCZ1/INTU/HSP4 first Longin domain-containing protein n=1 Tax=Synchytrium endobioticum TaxID=286115 RepID=A0A507DFI8_9FUNG|nr:hypothetical protein SeMB42_g06280 [Synchytrium endobioticum]TPX50324.1 hypothetical protein SeLEV6574_g00976 [Synchytrium endobioticum]